MLIALLFFVMMCCTAVADTPAAPTPYSKVVGAYRFVMLAKDGDSVVRSSSGKTYPASGLYRDDGSVDPLWTVDWYAFEGQVFFADDARYMSRLGPWPLAGNYGELAVAFYDHGKLLKRYVVSDLVRRPEELPHSESHYSWHRNVSSDVAAARLSVETEEGETLAFDMRTGERTGAPAASTGRPVMPWMIAAGLAVGALALLLFRLKRMR